MVHPEGSHGVKVGVLLARQPGDLGDWLADGAAFDAAGADALWVDLLPEVELDSLVLMAALASVTYRSLLVLTSPGSDGAAPARSRVLATIERLSRGRLRIPDSDPDAQSRFAEVGSVLGVIRRIPAEPEAAEHAPDPDGPRTWVAAPLPDSRATWRNTLLTAAERGIHGLVVPADPRLLDLLRNPEDIGGRSDLQLAIG